MYPALYGENKLLLIEREKQVYFPATHVPAEYLHLLIPYAGICYDHDDDYDMLSQHMQLGPFSLWIHDVFSHNEIVLCPYTPFHLWALHFMFEDSLRAEIFQAERFVLAEKQCNLFSLYADLHKAPMPANKKILSFHINIQPADLALLAGIYPSLGYLARKRPPINISGPVNEQPYLINPLCNLLIQNILTCRFVEQQAAYFLFRCCVDLFLNFAHQDTTAHKPALLSDPVNTEIFNRLFTYLVEHPHIDHSISELAEIHNMQPVKLAMGFREHFHIGITAFMRMQQMMLAYNLLFKNPLPLAEIAKNLQFRNAQEMVSAVERYYRCNVPELRRVM